MNISKTLLLAAAVVFPWAAAATAQNDTPAQAELKAIQGIWQVAKWVDPDGTLAPADEIKGTSFEFKDDRVIKRTDGLAREPLKVALDPSKKPKWIDFDSGDPLDVKKQGIYKLEGGELTICIISGSRGDRPPERPTEFKANK